MQVTSNKIIHEFLCVPFSASLRLCGKGRPWREAGRAMLGFGHKADADKNLTRRMQC